MKRKIRTFFVLALSALSLNLWAWNITVHSFPFIDKLPSNSVQRVLQDKDGFLWFGTTDGLCRYDAYRLQVFRSDLSNPHLLFDNEITALAEDSDNHLWIGTHKGLNLLDRETLKIIPFGDKQTAGKDIRCVLVASDSTIWVGVDNAVYRYNTDLTLCKRYVASSGEKAPLPRSGINSIYEDSFGDIWISLWENGLHKYKKEEDSFIHFPPVGRTNNPFKVFQDSRKQYWICTWGDGLYQFSPNGNKETMYRKQVLYNKNRKQPEDTFFSIVEDRYPGYLWILSYYGIYALRYDQENRVKQVDLSALFKGTNNIFSEIVKDRDGNLWIGAFDEGPITVNFNKPEIENWSLEPLRDRVGVTPNITAVLKEEDGTIWLNQNRFGLCLYHPLRNELKTYKDYPSLKDIPILSNVSVIKKIRGTDEIWVGLEYEPVIYLLKKKGEQISLSGKIDLSLFGSDAGNLVDVFEDSKNDLWILTTRSVFIRSHHDKKIYAIDSSVGEAADIAEDAKGAIWIASKGNGLFMVPLGYNTDHTDLSRLKITNYSKRSGTFISDNIQAVCADPNGDLWIGTKEGDLLRYDHHTRKMNIYTRQCGLKGDALLDILVDDFHHIWITTNKKITEYNPQNGAFREYSPADGLLVNSFIKGATFKNGDYLYFGGNQGLSALRQSDQLRNPVVNAHVLISDIQIQNRSMLNDSANHSFKAISHELVLYPKDRNLEISFTSLNYAYPDKIHYAYKMDGVDDDWVYTSGDRPFATYNQLKKGKNIFWVKATDENRLWSSDVTQLNIYKYPDFYETWWAYLIYLLIMLLAAWVTFRILKNRIHLRNELKIAQIEKEKSEELAQTKLRYFTNISHDLLTPLTIIYCLIDDIEAIFQKKIPQYGMIRSNVDRLRRLLQQVLDFRKMESGNMKLKITQGDISAFIRDLCVTNFAPLFDKKHIGFTFTSVPTNIYAYYDVDKVDKIVYNLLSNAVKYTPDNGAVKVWLQAYEKDGYSFLSIQVSDTGIGIPPENLEKIFTRFYYNKKIDAGKTNGIGLSLTRDLVELHRGTIVAESEEGKGSTFRVHLPIDKASFSGEELDLVSANKTDTLMATGANEWKTEEDGSEKENVRLLVVEDNEDLLYTMENILSRRYQVMTAVNGLLALEIVKNKEVDILVSDVMMPEMDGLELCRTLKTNIETSHIPVILLTAKNSVSDRIECYNAGADGYITKPFELQVLEARINNFITNKRRRQQEFKSNVEINIAALEYASPDEQFLNNAVQLIEKYLSDSGFDINTFAEYLHLSKSSLYRKIKIMTGLSPIELIRNIRLKHACKMLGDPSFSIAEVAYSVGFSDPKYFASCFKSEFNVTPSEYQRSVGKDREEESFS